MSRHLPRTGRGPDLGLGVPRQICNEPKAPDPLLALPLQAPVPGITEVVSLLPVFPLAWVEPWCGVWGVRPLLCTHISRNAFSSSLIPGQSVT